MATETLGEMKDKLFKAFDAVTETVDYYFARGYRQEGTAASAAAAELAKAIIAVEHEQHESQQFAPRQLDKSHTLSHS